MTEDAGTKPSEESVGAASAMRQRKKRRWDEPADFLISTGISIPGAIPIGFGNSLGISTPGVLPVSNAIATNTLVPLITHSATTLVQKLSQSKVQDELIAREIVINDAEPTIRYKLTKRQTQEEIQRSTGAIVITRGKYRPPNALPDNEKPLYLHISAGSHLKDMAERIIAVDRAASMVEEILRQGHNLLSNSCSHSAGQVNQPMSICLFLGFEPDPSQNIAARIRGPNDQYINHIINETGATVVLRGLGSGSNDISHAEDAQQPLHLYLSSTNSKSLEAARSLAENLLDTISAECAVSRVPSSKVYRAVPPPHQLLAGVVSSANADPVVSSSCAVAGVTQAGQSLASSTSAVSSLSTVLPSGVLIPNGNLASCGTSIPNTGNYVYPTVTGGTCYSGYGGIYPQATPLQQVALALKQAPLSSTSVVSSAASNANALPKMTSSSNADREKRPSQKRKFQELPVTSKGLSTLNQNSRQGSECFKPGLEDAAGKIPFMPPTKKSSQPALGELPPPPPPRMMPPPPPKFSSDHNRNSIAAPPPPNFPSSDSPVGFQNQNPAMSPAVTETLVQSIVSEKASLEPASDTFLKLVEYEEEEEEEMVAAAEESFRSTSSKPFWAV
ncbi:protein RIK isoform X1 [Dendrobium catenatum]|uniref:protein RIK isoform X1 n=1 Tax=Dendrobium catenatum TaxID=906689 RepID=UPI0009F3EB15|nr:protein RIK isoform X1 [Dendrobium catenatum]